MKVLILSPCPEKITAAFNGTNDIYLVTEEPISASYCQQQCIDFIVSYGYRHLISREVLNDYRYKAINLHMSMLPHGRGAHPLFWSLAEGLKTGVSIHLIEEGLDTGNLLYQKEIPIDTSVHTFRTAYRELSSAMEELFIQNWRIIRLGCDAGRPQIGSPTIHKSIELESWKECLPCLWDTPIELFLALSKATTPGIVG